MVVHPNMTVRYLKIDVIDSCETKVLLIKLM